MSGAGQCEIETIGSHGETSSSWITVVPAVVRGPADAGSGLFCLAIAAACCDAPCIG
ncbi:hypothetical protein MYA_4121 [Burkholderia sp. KJ006]|nr:hypothetical protein MYA_4121 [Burkholderia sp. KJ006]